MTYSFKIHAPDGSPVKTLASDDPVQMLAMVQLELGTHTENRVKILEAGIIEALNQLESDNFRSQAIAFARQRLERVLDGRY